VIAGDMIRDLLVAELWHDGRHLGEVYERADGTVVADHSGGKSAPVPVRRAGRDAWSFPPGAAWQQRRALNEASSPPGR
jgi:hypothetical protein